MGPLAAWLLAAVSGPAWAGVALVHDGSDETTAVVVAVRGTGLPADQLDPVPLPTVLEGRPSAVGQATLRHCVGATTRNSEVQANLVRAEAAWRKGDTAGAMDLADLGIAGLGCLGERVERPTAARLFLLRGGLMARDGQVSAAEQELRTALSLVPDVQWDEWLPSDGRVLLEGLRAEAPAGRLGVAPATMSVGPWLDGADPTAGGFTARRGLHLLQVPGTGGLSTGWLTVEGDAVIVVPGSFRAPDLAQLDDPAARGDLERLVQVAAAGGSAYVVGADGLWLVTFDNGRPHTETLVAPTPPPVVEEPQGRKRRKR